MISLKKIIKSYIYILNVTKLHAKKNPVSFTHDGSVTKYIWK